MVRMTAIGLDPRVEIGTVANYGQVRQRPCPAVAISLTDFCHNLVSFLPRLLRESVSRYTQLYHGRRYFHHNRLSQWNGLNTRPAKMDERHGNNLYRYHEIHERPTYQKRPLRLYQRRLSSRRRHHQNLNYAIMCV